MSETAADPAARGLPPACSVDSSSRSWWASRRAGSATSGSPSGRPLRCPRIFVFLAIGVVIFALITFWPRSCRTWRRPGVVPLASGLLMVIAAQTIMNWYDPLDSNRKFGGVRAAADATAGLSSVTVWFFDWLAWTLLAVGLLACGAAIVTRLRALGYLTGAIGVVGAVLAYVAHRDIVDVGGGIDHSLGVYADLIGFLVIAGAGVTAVHSRVEVADTRRFLRTVAGYRPGLPFGVVGVILGVLAYTQDGWFGPLTINATFADSRSDFAGTGISALASQYLHWLGWVLFAAAALLALTASLPGQPVGRLGVRRGLAHRHRPDVLHVPLDDECRRAKIAPQHGGNWKNLGVGGYMACIVFALFVAAAVQAAMSATAVADANGVPAQDLPVTTMVGQMRRSSTGRATRDRRRGDRAVLPADAAGDLAERARRADRRVRAAGPRPQRRRRLGRPARPRLHRVLRDRRIHDGLLRRRAADEAAALAADAPRC